jgi:predicted outer membrane repeat protein
VLLAIGLGLAAPARAAGAATIVTDCTEAGLAAAVAAGGAISFNCAGPTTITATHVLTIALDTTLNGGEVITLSGGGSQRLFIINSGVAFKLAHIALTRAFSGGNDGGALTNHGRLTLDHATISNSKADLNHSGAAIFSDGPVTITDSTLVGNYGGSAGALFANFSHAVVTINNSTFSNNRAYNTVTGYGGAIWVGEQAQLTFSGGALISNTAQFGGGIYISQEGVVTITSAAAPVLINGNSATGAGGAIYNSQASIALTHVELRGNSALNSHAAVVTFGGGIDAFQAATTLSDATLLSNTADLGGGLYVVSGTLALTDTQLISDVAQSGDGGAIGMQSRAQTQLANVVFAQNRAAGNGGGLASSQGSLVLNGASFSDNKAGGYGGGLELFSGQMTMSAVTFDGNAAKHGGGAIDNGENVLTATDLLLTNNAADIGGAVYNGSAALVLTAATFSGNRALTGGAIENDGGLVNATGGTFSDNGASQSGGAIDNEEGGVLTLTSSTLNDNFANTYGGALFALQGSAALLNDTLSGNHASAGGGLYDGSARVALTNVTLAGNSASANGGGVYTVNALANETVSISNTLLLAGALGQNCAGAGVLSHGYNLSSDGTCAAHLNQVGDLNNTHPQLGPLANNGGPTLTLLPSASSPAVDAIPNGTNECGVLLTVDQRGAPRPIQGQCDIGAVEAGWIHAALWLPLARR